MNIQLPMLDQILPRKRPRIHTTLLDLVRAINQVTDDDRQVTAVVTHLINRG